MAYDKAAVTKYRQSAKGKLAKARGHKKWRTTNPLAKTTMARCYQRAIEANPTLYVFSQKRVKAKQYNIPFSLNFDEMIWPRICPVLGTEIDYSRGKRAGQATFNSPSFDRVMQSGPYSHDNVLIVSNRANSLRRNHTTEQLAQRAVTSEMIKVFKFYSTLEADLLRNST